MVLCAHWVIKGTCIGTVEYLVEICWQRSVSLRGCVRHPLLHYPGETPMESPQSFWLMVVACCGMWAFVAVVKTVVDGIVQVRQEKAQVQREYLSQMMSEIAEIKERLDISAKEASRI